MDVFKLLKEYLPIITAFLGATLAYIFNNRKYKFERFHTEIEESLKGFYSPIFHEMRNIKLDMEHFNKEKLKDKEKLLNDFIKKHVREDTGVYKSFNGNLIELLYEMDELLIKYSIDKEEKYIKESIKKFNKIYLLVEREYWDIQKSLYREYHWHKQLNKRSYIIRAFMELCSLFYDTMQFFAIILGVVLYMIAVDRITKTSTPSIPSVISDNFRNVALSILLTYFIALAIKVTYSLFTNDYKRENKLLKKLDKIIFQYLKKKYIDIKKC